MSTTQPTNPYASVAEMLDALDGIARIDQDAATIEIHDANAFRDGPIDCLVATSAFAEGPQRDASRWVIRAAAAALGAWPASIHPLYMAAGRGEYAGRTAPAINVRGLAYDTMRAVFRAARANDNKIMLFELARSETA